MTLLHVLHVDDESDIREVVEISLGFESDFVARSCGSGEEALLLAADWTPDIILLDVMMPVMDGPATLVRLRDNAKTARIPVLFMTARVQARELDLFYSLGAAGVIAKPFDPMTLAASVRAHVRSTPNLDFRLDALREVFLRRVDDEAVELMKCRCRIEQGEAQATWADIMRIAHGLAGAGGIFGFPEISNAAATLEEAIMFEQAGSSPEEIACLLDCLLVCIAMNRSQRGEIQPFRLRAH